MAKAPKVPTVDAGDDEPDQPEQPDRRFDEIQLRGLDAEAKAKENLNTEADQRYWLRWLAVAICVVIVLGMGSMLSHVVHRLMTLKTFGAPSAYIIAIYVAPILSITSLSIALLVAAFRGFKDGDGDSSTKALSEGAKVGKLLH